MYHILSYDVISDPCKELGHDTKPLGSDDHMVISPRDTQLEHDEKYDRWYLLNGSTSLHF